MVTRELLRIIPFGLSLDGMMSEMPISVVMIAGTVSVIARLISYSL